MYAAIRRYHFDPSNSEEIDRRIRDAFVYLLRKAPGFEAYYWINTGEGEGASISVFDTEAGAQESNRIAARFVAEHLTDLLGTPERLQGKVHARADRRWPLVGEQVA